MPRFATFRPPSVAPTRLQLVPSGGAQQTVDIDRVTERFAGTALAEAAGLLREAPSPRRLPLPEVPARGAAWLAATVESSPREPPALPAAQALEALTWDEQYLGGTRAPVLVEAVMQGVNPNCALTRLVEVEAQRARQGSVPVDRLLRRLSFRLADCVVDHANAGSGLPAAALADACEPSVQHQVERALTQALLRAVARAPDEVHKGTRSLVAMLAPSWNSAEMAHCRKAFAACRALADLPLIPWQAAADELAQTEAIAAELFATEGKATPIHRSLVTEAREGRHELRGRWLQALQDCVLRSDLEGSVAMVAEAPADARGEPATWPLALISEGITLTVGDVEVVRFILEAAPREDRQACWAELLLRWPAQEPLDLDLVALVAEASDRPDEILVRAALQAVACGDVAGAACFAARLHVEAWALLFEELSDAVNGPMGPPTPASVDDSARSLAYLTLLRGAPDAWRERLLDGLECEAATSTE